MLKKRPAGAAPVAAAGAGAAGGAAKVAQPSASQTAGVKPAGAKPVAAKPAAARPAGAKPARPLPLAGRNPPAAPVVDEPGDLGDAEEAAGYVAPPAFGAPALPAAQPGAAPAGPSRRKVRLILVVVTLVLAAAVAVALWLHFRPRGGATGVIRFRGVDGLDPAAKLAFHRRQQDLLAAAVTRSLARTMAGDAPPGFLGDSADQVVAYDAFARAAAWNGRGDALAVRARGSDPAADRRRIKAVLDAMYERNGALSADLRRDRAARDEAAKALRAASEKVADLEAKAANAAELVKAEPQLRAEVDGLKDKTDALVKDLNSAHEAVRRLERELEQTQAQVQADAAAVAPATQPATRPAVAAGPTTLPAAEEDADLKQLVADLRVLENGLRESKAARDAQAGEAKAALDQAQSQFDAQVDAARAAVGNDAGLGDYVAKLQALQESIRKLNDELVQEQKEGRDLLDGMKSRILAMDAERLKQAWAEDADLKALHQQLSVAEHRLNAAAAGRLPEAAALKGQVADLNGRVEKRRAEVAGKEQANPQVKEVQDFVDDSLRRMDQSRLRNEARLQDLFKQSTAAAPDMDKLPAGQKAVAKRMDEAAKSLSGARAKYNTRVEEADARADAMVKLLTGQVAGQQARIDDRRKVLAARAAEQAQALRRPWRSRSRRPSRSRPAPRRCGSAGSS